VVRAEQNVVLRRELENAQLLDRHFTEQKATLLRRSIPKCENEDANGRSCEAEAKDVCVHCERALCVSGGCFDDVCSAAPDGKHLAAKVAIESRCGDSRAEDADGGVSHGTRAAAMTNAPAGRLLPRRRKISGRSGLRSLGTAGFTAWGTSIRSCGQQIADKLLSVYRRSRVRPNRPQLDDVCAPISRSSRGRTPTSRLTIHKRNKLTRRQRIEAAIARETDRKKLRLLNKAWWKAYFDEKSATTRVWIRRRPAA
jgi:hypothetical protein